MELPSKGLEAFLTFAKECQDTYQIAYACVSDEDKRLQDLLHAVEFTDNKYDMHNEALRFGRAGASAGRTRTYPSCTRR